MAGSERDTLVDPVDRDITSIARHARECLRTVWNSYYRTLFDAEHAFFRIQDAILDDLLFSQVAEDRVLTSGRGFTYHSGIGISATPGSEKTEVLVPEKLPDGFRWERRVIPLHELDLRFGCFFDFVTFDEEYRDFEYVEGVIVGDRTGAHALGDRLLIPALSALYVAT